MKSFLKVIKLILIYFLSSLSLNSSAAEAAWNYSQNGLGSKLERMIAAHEDMTGFIFFLDIDMCSVFAVLNERNEVVGYLDRFKIGPLITKLFEKKALVFFVTSSLGLLNDENVYQQFRDIVGEANFLRGMEALAKYSNFEKVNEFLELHRFDSHQIEEISFLKIPSLDTEGSLKIGYRGIIFFTRAFIGIERGVGKKNVVSYITNLVNGKHIFFLDDQAAHIADVFDSLKDSPFMEGRTLRCTLMIPWPSLYPSKEALAMELGQDYVAQYDGASLQEDLVVPKGFFNSPDLEGRKAVEPSRSFKRPLVEEEEAEPMRPLKLQKKLNFDEEEPMPMNRSKSLKRLDFDKEEKVTRPVKPLKLLSSCELEEEEEELVVLGKMTKSVEPWRSFQPLKLEEEEAGILQREREGAEPLEQPKFSLKNLSLPETDEEENLVKPQKKIGFRPFQATPHFGSPDNAS